ncbi:hypothetical protein HN385_00975 [archaeon]|jgi:hypothetical protein|nr:hypothetical protein [archaeon]MBT3450619.1 hypothetical protein [archaeon]MBT6868695.1 hypothetical protein [archaeon]MBT7193483.1 hypothetical protein [archaeon]MBT7381074.1 hypothetical protein [archaeon]
MEKQSSRFREISKGKYIMAGVLTFLIFSLGLTMGIILEEMRYNEAQEINEEQDVSYLSLQLQYLMLTSFEDQSNCPVLLTTLQDSIDELSGSLSKIIDYEKENSISSDDYLLISRRYTLDNLRYWLMAEKAKESCQLDMVSILYFYSDDCPSCPNQGTILSYFKKLMGDQLLVFPINLDLREDEAMIEVMMSLYNVTKFPTIIVEGDKYEGVIKKNDLQEIICSNLESSDACEIQLEDLEQLNVSEQNESESSS